MTELAINGTRAGFLAVQQVLSDSVENLRQGISAPSREVLILGAILIALQIMDGVLTAIGVYHFGISAEGNPLLYHLMINFGYISTLAFTKGLSIAIVVVLCYLSTRVQWLPKALGGVIVIYIGAAIIPWSVILFTRLVIT